MVQLLELGAAILLTAALILILRGVSQAFGSAASRH
jgi:hypothetical protein